MQKNCMPKLINIVGRIKDLSKIGLTIVRIRKLLWCKKRRKFDIKIFCIKEAYLQIKTIIIAKNM